MPLRMLGMLVQDGMLDSPREGPPTKVAEGVSGLWS